MISEGQAKQMVEAWGEKQPGKRGVDIPADIHDKIAPALHGAMQPLFGRPGTPQQLQHLYDNGLHEPSQIHDAVAGMDHPHAPGLTVGEYSKYSKAFDTFRAHRG